jgi:LPS sulfotransferase NodH
VAPRFTSFVILGAMRTGSNWLESSLNEIEGLTCYGEVFNPEFIGRKGVSELFGIDLAAREADPLRLLRRLSERTEGLAGFRLFQGHDSRVLDWVLADPSCAKIVLTRNPVDSFVSLRIAVATDQWMLRNERNRRTARVRFDGDAFAAYLGGLEAFYDDIRRRLQISGQAAFVLRYGDLGDPAVLNGLAAWLGAPGRIERPSATLRKQNPTALDDKVENPEAIAAALLRHDLLDPGHLPSFEPARRPQVASYLAAPRAPLLFLPVPGAPGPEVAAWLGALDGAGAGDCRRDFTRRSLSEWRAARPGHLAFTVVRHPLERAHEGFVRHILQTGPESFPMIRARLRSLHGLDLPEGGPGAGWTLARHRAAFLGFLVFLRANLAGQTSIRVDPAWASQAALLQGFCALQPPDLILRAERLGEGLAWLAAQIGRPAPPPITTAAAPAGPVALSEIYDAEIEAAARAACARDYTGLGYGNWAPPEATLRRP